MKERRRKLSRTKSPRDGVNPPRSQEQVKRRDMNRKIALLITIIVAVGVLPLSFAGYKELYVRPFLESQPAHLRPYIDYKPFFSTGYGVATVVTWLVLIFLWGFEVVRFLKRKLNEKELKNTICVVAIATVLILALTVSLFRINFVQAKWNVYNEVDVLCIADEEFRANPNWITNAENVLQDVSDNRFEESYIRFYLRGWLEWDSLDSRTDTYDLMQVALAESGLPRQQVEILPDFWDWGFISGSEWVDGDGVTWWIDLLLIFTGQDCDMRGLSIPMCNMTIIRYNEVNLHVMTHELGHQYYLEHCDNPFCVMNVDWQLGDNFCESCRAKLNNNKDKWMTDPEVYYAVYYQKDDGTVEFEEPGCFTAYFNGENHTLPNHETFFGYGGMFRVRCGIEITFYVTEYESYFLNITTALNAPPIFTQDPDDPPPKHINFGRAYSFSFIMNDTWTFAGWFNKGRKLTLSTFSGEGTLNPSEGEHWFRKGTEVTLTATPLEGYNFYGWLTDTPLIYLILGDKLCLVPGAVDDNPLTVTITEDMEIQAVFDPVMVLFPVYCTNGAWLTEQGTISYRPSGTTTWTTDFRTCDYDARGDGMITIVNFSSVVWEVGVKLLDGAAYEHYNYYAILPSGTYDFKIEYPGYQTKYFYNIEIPTAETASTSEFFIGFYTVALSPSYGGGGGGGRCRLLLY